MRASHLDLFEQPGIRVFNESIKCVRRVVLEHMVGLGGIEGPHSGKLEIITLDFNFRNVAL
jgi:hypothetical protein